MDINAINRDTADKLNSDYRNKLKGKSTAPAKKNTSEIIHEEIYAPPRKAAEKKFTQSQMKTLGEVVSRKPGTDPEKERQAQAKVKALKIRKIVDYKSRAIFGTKLQHIRIPPQNAPMEVVDSVLDEIREILASDGAEAQIRMLPRLAASGMEFVTMQWHFNPLQWDLEGFGSAFDDPRVMQSLEPSLTEVVVENKHYLCSPAWVRLCSGMVFVAGKYSHHRQESKPVDEETKEKFSDL